MKAITVEPKKPGTARYEDIPEPDEREGSVLEWMWKRHKDNHSTFSPRRVSLVVTDLPSPPVC
jgi:hypothetical protein